LIALMVHWRAFMKSDRSFRRLVHVLVGMICAEGRHTITGSIRFRRRDQGPWSADYAAFSRASWEPEALFEVALAAGAHRAESVAPGAPIVIAIDDTAVKKSSRVIAAARWMRDPLSPPFNVNLQLGLRFFHSALVLPLHEVGFAPRAVSVGFALAPSPRKPRRKASPEEWAAFRRVQQTQSLPLKAAAALAAHRAHLDKIGLRERTLLAVGDGGYTNSTLLGALPERTEFVGRTRKDIALFRPAPPGGQRVYGERLPTPDAIRQDEGVPYVSALLFYGGARREVRFKDVPGVLWPRGTKRRWMRLIIIAPTPYTAEGRSGRKFRYNEPGYLLTTDLQSPATTLVQAVLDRWQIEPLHRDLKTGLGVGEAQNWNDNAVTRVHAAMVATWSLITLATLDAFGVARTEAFGPLPAWRRVRANHRASQQDILHVLRTELLGGTNRGGPPEIEASKPTNSTSRSRIPSVVRQLPPPP
jgi:hypothetical protein